MNQPETKQPDEVTPRVVGAEMARLRAQFGLSPQEVSERLHIRPRYIAAMEEGRYELMPAKAYARGYMHSYAEFLGMDADEVVAKCFAQQAAAAPAPVMPTPRMTASPSAVLSKSPWRGYAIMAVVALVALVLVTQLGGLFGGDTSQEATVTPVPDAMLSSVRSIVMPTASNHACLTDNQPLDCFHADATTQALSQLNLLTLGQFAMNIDISDLILDAPELTADTVDDADAEDPDA